MQDFHSTHYQRRSNPWPLVIVGAATFAVGAAAAFGFASWQASQKATIAALEQRLEQMQDQITTQDTVTRAQTPDLTDVAAIAAATVEEEPELTAEEAAALAIDPSIQNRDHLEDRIAQARAIAGRIKLERLADGEVVGMLQREVLEGNYSVEARSINDDTIGVSLQSRRHANTAGLLADILATSANSGSIEVPDYIAVSETGEVDSGTLLFDLVQRSLQNGTAEEIAAAEELSQRTVEAFQTASARQNSDAGAATIDVADRYYTVESGDNLAYLALQFYGRTDAYDIIFAANRNILSDPDRIQVGQRLLIPEA